jgi:hypothetical protein
MPESPELTGPHSSQSSPNNLHVRVVHAATGELLRELTIDPTRDYQPTHAPKGPTRPQNKRSEPQ